MITVKDAVALIRERDEIFLGWNGLLVPFNQTCALDMDAYGDYLVSGIRANGENAIELDLLAVPTKISDRT